VEILFLGKRLTLSARTHPSIRLGELAQGKWLHRELFPVLPSLFLSMSSAPPQPQRRQQPQSCALRSSLELQRLSVVLSTRYLKSRDHLFLAVELDGPG